MHSRSLLLCAAMLCAGAATAQAQTVTNRTTDVAISFDNTNNFANASGVYNFGLALPDQAPFTGAIFNFMPLGNATNITFQSGLGGVTISVPAPPYSPPATIPVSQDDPTGTAGSWSASYTTAASTSGPLLTFSTLDGNNVLNFNGGGSMTSADGTDYNGIDYYVFAHIAGDWSTLGTATGDLDLLGVGAGFNSPTVTYDAITNTTTVETFTRNYTDGESVGLDFDLIGGAAVPEPAVWAMLLTGFFGVGASLRRSRRRAVTA